MMKMSTKPRIYIPRFNGKEYVAFPTYAPNETQKESWTSNKNLRYDLPFNSREDCNDYIKSYLNV
jgi:hypothetical protein